tara:strand:- start:2016 stop:3233 length:1218 start_codon:yes stop_codon:yes gene_type:complete
MSSIFSALNSLKTNIFGGQSYVGANAPGSNTPILRKSAIELADRSPTSRLDNDPLSFSSVSYPHDIVADGTNGHYMLFYINVQNQTKFAANYQTPRGLTVEEQVDGQNYGAEQMAAGQAPARSFTKEQALLEGKGTSLSNVKELAASNKTLANGKLVAGNISSAIARTAGTPPTTRITDSIAIYLPPNVTDSYANTYNATETGLLGYIAASGGAITQAYRDEDFVKAAEGILGTGKGLLTELSKNLGLSIAEIFTQAEGGYELANKIFGQSANPYLEVLYGGPQLRTFTYQFKFAPKNERERDNVQKIIQLFRFHSAPEMKDNHNMFLGLPSEFDIHYMYQAEDGVANENSYYPKIATCVLQSVNTNFTPGGVRSHADGSPVVITMDLQFLETELITKDHIQEGF